MCCQMTRSAATRLGACTVERQRVPMELRTVAGQRNGAPSEDILEGHRQPPRELSTTVLLPRNRTAPESWASEG